MQAQENIFICFAYEKSVSFNQSILIQWLLLSFIYQESGILNFNNDKSWMRMFKLYLKLIKKIRLFRWLFKKIQPYVDMQFVVKL